MSAGDEKAPAGQESGAGLGVNRRAPEDRTPEEGVSLPGTSSPSPAGTLQPDYNASLDFLQKFRPGGPWVLSAIRPDRKEIVTRTFYGTLVSELMGWLERVGPTYNLYFSVNPTTRPMQRKTEKEDIKELAWLHVDLDQGADETLEASRARNLALLTTKLPEGIPQPTCIVDSGGGYWGFWKLEEPLEVGGDRAKAEDVERYNIELEHLFKADRCHNVDRIARLPGTINWPNEKKAAKGRVAAPALVVSRADLTYPISAFSKSPATPTTGIAGHEVQLSGNIPRVTLADLPKNLPELCKVVIVQGHDPDDPKRWPSRSEALMYVMCELVRYGCTNQQICAVITDPDFGISASVLDKARPMKEAARQIGRARERAIDPLLEEFNSKHAVIESYGGRCRITSWERAALAEGSRELLQFQSFSDFRNRYSNRFVEVKEKDKSEFVPAGDWWTRHRLRRQFKGIVFDPSVDGSVGEYMNLWRGYSIAPKPGNYPLFRELVESVLASEDAAVAAYLWKWTAWLIQNPHRQAEVGLVFRGRGGTGKGTFARTLGRLFGQHFVHVSSNHEVTGNFNAHMRDCVLLFADEAVLGGGEDAKKAVGTLKRIITEPTIRVEPKGVDSIEWPNRLHVIVASNEDWVVPADADDRRFVVLDVSDVRKEDEVWFAALDAELAGGGLAALLHDMLAMDLGDWHPRRDRPQTAALTDQKVASLTGLDKVWFECLRSGELPVGEHDGADIWLPSSSFVKHADRTWRPKEAFTTTALSALLGEPQSNHKTKSAGMGFEQRRRQKGKGPCGYVIPRLAAARLRWDERRFPFRWDDSETWTIPGQIDEEAYKRFI